MRNILGWILIVGGIGLLIGVVYYNNHTRQIPIVFSPKLMLASTWKDYKDKHIDQSGRTVDYSRDDITTSEGQSYTMLRAVWMDDKETFDKSWQWTRNSLRRQEDSLSSWLFGKQKDGSYRVMTETGGYNSASDADTDIALALIFAHSRWRNDDYLESAKRIVNDIWEKEVILIKSRPYLAANNLEKARGDNLITVNPSYFSPYAYRIFSKIDPEHDWIGLVDTSYEIIKASISNKLDKDQGGLPPDWIWIDRTNASISPASSSGLTTNYGFDAMRIPWRLALDFRWNEEPRAREILNELNILKKEWLDNRIIYAGYSHDGQAVAAFEAPAFYGGNLGYFLLSEPEISKEIYERKLRSLYNPDKNSWQNDLSYYDDNWAWFGLSLYHDMLPNLFAEQRPSTATKIIEYLYE